MSQPPKETGRSSFQESTFAIWDCQFSILVLTLGVVRQVRVCLIKPKSLYRPVNC